MMKQRKIPIVGLMMITSQLLLSLFLGYWLYAQFNEKKNLLGVEIERGLRNSEEQVIDSMLATNLINPIINDSGIFSVYMIDSLDVDSLNRRAALDLNNDSIHRVQMIISHKHEDEISPQPKIYGKIGHIEDTAQVSGQDLQSTITVSAEVDSSNQLLFQGVKLLINSVGKFEANQNSINTFFSSNPDTALLRKIFDDFIKKNHNSISVVWRSIDRSEISKNEISRLVFISYLFEDPYGVSVHNYFIYLLKSISAQIAFALILLLITALAFRRAFINLKSQRKLLTIKNDFISNITHELKTPVSTVKVALEALLAFNLRENEKTTKEYLEMAHIEMDRLDLLVNQVLNNSALEDGNSFITTENINLVSAVEDVLFSMKSHLDKQNASVTFNPSEEVILVKADKLHLHGLIVNLLDNSLKYTEQIPEIIIGVKQDKMGTELTISDNGIGIPKEYIGRIFDKFFRVPKGDEHNVKGYGLGLNYVALVMEQYKGKIKVNCSDKGGSCFTLIFCNPKPTDKI